MLLSTISIFGAASLLLTSVYAQGNVTDSELPNFLGIQDAESGSISEINATAYVLELNDVSDKTILFADRPERIVETISTSDFIGNWSAEEESFQKDPPNAALVVLTNDNQKQDRFEIELLNPKYEKNEKILRYDFTFLGNTTGSDLPDFPIKLGKSALIIDNFFKKLGRNANCVWVCL